MPNKYKINFISCFFLLLTFLHAEEKPLNFGMSTALNGPAATLGINMRDGCLAAFEECNRNGGVKGKKLKLIAIDDGYEPIKTVPNMKNLIVDKKVFGVIGNVGTPTAVAAIPIALKHKTLFYGAFTGAGVLRKNPPDRYVINYRASYAQETAAMVDALILKGGLKLKQISFFTQRDAYGDAGFIGGIEALKKHGLQSPKNIAHGRYKRNTLAIENGLADIIEKNPNTKAIIMVGAYAPCAKFILQAESFGLKALFLNVSFVGAAPLAEALKGQSQRVIITQVVPHIDSHLPVISSYKNALKKYNPNLAPTFGSLEGYISSRILIKALKSQENAFTRESIIDALENLKEFDIGINEKLFLSKQVHQASNRVWPTLIDGKDIKPFDWTKLKSLLPST